MYETEDLPYKHDAEEFLPEYVEERKKMHGLMTESSNPAETTNTTAEHTC